jgi:hypothetical protein
MTLCWRLKNQKFVVWHKPASGDKMVPFNNPEDRLDLVEFSSTFDYYKILSRSTHTINHTAVAAATTIFDYNPTSGYVAITGPRIAFGGQVVKNDYLLYTHSLGYAPSYMIAIGDQLLQDYYPIQSGTDTLRTVSFYATDTEIRCVDIGTSSDVAGLSAISQDYEVLLFRPASDGYDPDLPMLSGVDGILAKGLINANDSLLRRDDGTDASPYDILLSPGVDIDRGWPCFVNGAGTLSMGTYAGTPPTPTIIQCAIP